MDEPKELDQTALHKLNASLTDAIVQSLSESDDEIGKLIRQGWTYFDLPKMKKSYYDYILASMGEGEYKNITVASYEEADGEWWRGQIIYSPQAKLNMQAYLKTHPIPAD